ncbi:SDR family NAD(P)-dependent oxidoreductase [Spirillospora sp. NPDC052269]
MTAEVDPGGVFGRGPGDRPRRPDVEVVGVGPFGRPAPHLAAAVCRAGGLGVLDLGTDRAAALAALADLSRWWRGDFGVRVPAGCGVRPDELPQHVRTVLLDAVSLDDTIAYARGRRLLVEVVDAAEAHAARASAGADGLIARGCEAGGRVGDLTTFVLLQHLLGDPEVTVPVLAAGGIGPHTAAAAVAGGAAGVVLDVQLALVRECELPRDVADALRAMDGSETRVTGGHRIFTRPDLPDFDLSGLSPAEANARLGASGLHVKALPVGQDGFLAAALGDRHRTAGGVVQAVREQVGEHLRAALTARPLAPRDNPPGTAISRDYPVVQGPMTRVSDRSAFAAAIAQDGGLPFLALALMGGDEVRDLLADTADRLGGRPWGVGVLGFAPPEVREAQIEAVLAARPPYALIAGGRPAQAAPLEDAGISTYLHVPSPGLLERFLGEGARKFVFEGLECGGHVGPRASFPLWEAQVQRLVEFADRTPGAADEMSVLFAGGIHDERSGAMVAALAGPLAERGADVRVLMGTAYLFTYEAVAAGAIMPGFQKTAVECAGTTLLETSPGHATRCARTPYVEAFEQARQGLEDAGTTRRRMWEQLEELNLGRLRIAAKGLRRGQGGGALETVGGAEQAREGMYMIGQVAALRSATTSITGLHEQVTSGALRFLESRAAALGVTTPGEDASGTGAAPLDVAIVGIGCVFPGAPEAADYWANIVRGVDAVTEVPADRWDPEVFFDPASRDGEKSPSKWGGFVPDVPFDAFAYGIPPNSLGSVEPVQLLALEVASRALRDAGYDERPFDRSRTSVVFGAEAGTELGTAYSARAILPKFYGQVPPGVDEQLPRLTEDSVPGVLTNVIAGRIANRLDLGGANYTVDAACAASLAALDAACKELVSGAADMVLCGGADLHNGINNYLLFSSVHALSRKGRCATFDASADGIALGEGVACVVLKRLADAERDGDRIYAVVKSVAGSSDGRSLGLTAPRVQGQRLALDRAYGRAGIAPSRVGLLEAHGTGTEVGDRTELTTLTETFTEAGAVPGGITLGSVKSQIGHTKCAAGLAGLIKTAYALHSGVLPGTLHLTEPNRAWGGPSSPFAFGRTTRPWAAAPGERFAGLSGFGFGGSNFHAVLAGYDGAPEPVSGVAAWPAELLLVRGADRDAARAEIDRLAALADVPGARLRDLARTFAEPNPARVQVAIVASGLPDLRAKLEAARGFRAVPGVAVAPAKAGETGKVAFLYPGQGSQRPNMLADLFVAFPRLQRLLRLADGRHARAMFPPAAFTEDDERAQFEAITDTRAAQPALGIAGLAAHRLLTELGVRPDLAAGHSYGELVALAAAGVFGEDDLVELSEARAEAILDAATTHGDDPGSMVACAGTLDEVRAAMAGISELVIANHNAPRQVVISGSTPALEQALQALSARRIAARRIPVAAAFHSPLVGGAAATLRSELSGRDLRSPAFPVWSNTTAEPYESEPAELRATLAGQVSAPVRFVEQIEAMYEAGARVFVEAGPGRVLTHLVGEILGDRPHTAVACDAPGEDGVVRLLHALADLAVAGVPVDAGALFAGRDARVLSAAHPPAVPGWIVNGHLVRTADGAHLTNSLRPAERVTLPSSGGPMPTAGHPEAASAAHSAAGAAHSAAGAAHSAAAGAPVQDPLHTAVLAYLRNSRELIAAQRDVVLGLINRNASPPARSGGPTVPPPRPVVSGDAVVSGSDAVVPGDAAVSGHVVPQPLSATPPVPAPGAVPLVRTPPDERPAAPGASVPGPEEIHATVLSVIGGRTGYPEAMLGSDLDLEADLSIDSIKRTEIIGELADRVGLAAAGARLDEAVVEQLAGIKTIGEIVAWIGARLTPSVNGSAPKAAVAAAETAADTAPPSPEPAGEAVVPPVRQVVRLEGLPALPTPEVVPGRFDGRVFAIVDDGCGIALELADLLEQQGAQVRTSLEAGEACDGLIHLAALRPGGGPVLPGAYAGIRETLLTGPSWLILGTGAGGAFGRGFDGGVGDPTPGAGLRGLARTLAKEFPETLVRAVDVDTKESPRTIALRLLAELLAPGRPVEVGYEGDVRQTLVLVREELPSVPGAAGPELGPDGVVLLTGGARGITARVALELARTTGCRIELLGRTPEPGAEDPELADAPDEAALRRALVARGGRTPAEIEARIRSVLAAREIRANLAALREHAAEVRYHPVDVRDAQAVRAVVEDAYRRYGRLDGVVHGAGLVEDRLVRDKTPESFGAVYGTKLSGASALVSAVRSDLRFFVVFGSVSGVYGNRGQADYAAANDACDTLARVWRTRLRGRVLVADWGPWAGGGMVSPEIAREYARRGVALVDPDAAVAALLREIASGDESQVVLAGTVADPAGAAGANGSSGGGDAGRGRVHERDAGATS